MKKIDSKKLLIISAACLLVVAVVLLIVCLTPKTGVVFECDFENNQYSLFTTDGYNEDSTTFSLEEDSGNKYVTVENTSDNDARFEKTIKLSKGTYKLEADIKVSGITSDSKGGNISILGSKSGAFTMVRSESSSWQHVTDYISIGEDDDYTLCLRLGYYGGTITGKASFDNVVVTKVSSAPSGVSVIDVTGSKSSKTVTSDAEYNENTYDDMRIVSWLIVALFSLVFLIYYRYVRVYDVAKVHEEEKGIKSTIIFLIIAAFVFRIILSVTYYQCSIDVGLFTYWGKTCVNSGIGNLYKVATGCDYPPLYLYFLSLFTIIANLLGGGTGITTCMIKMPSMLADLVIGYLIYRIAKKQGLTNRMSLFVMSFWLFNPMVLLDSACWGQVDSLLALFVLLTCIFINRKQYHFAGIFFGLGVMLKPQMIIFLPVCGCIFIYDFAKTVFFDKEIKKGLLSLCYVIVGIFLGLFVPCIPFLGMGTAELSFLGKEVTLPWVFSLFLGTIDHYSYATVNYYNFWFLLGKNWKTDSEMFGKLTYYQWGMMAIVVISLIVVAVFAVKFVRNVVKKQNTMNPGFIYLCGTFMYFAVSCFGPRMHERYFFPGIMMLLIAFIYYGRKRMLLSFWLSAEIGFITVHEIMLGLLCGGSIRDAGGAYDSYSDYYWPRLNEYRGYLAAVVVICAIIAAAYVLFNTKLGKKTPELSNNRKKSEKR